MTRKQNFRERRLALGLNKAAAAKLSNLDPKTIKNAEDGKNITVNTLNALEYLYSRMEELTNVKSLCKQI